MGQNSYSKNFQNFLIFISLSFSHEYKTLCSYLTINSKKVRAVKLLQYVKANLNLKGSLFLRHTVQYRVSQKKSTLYRNNVLLEFECLSTLLNSQGHKSLT
jgi:hypothetical protein